MAQLILFSMNIHFINHIYATLWATLACSQLQHVAAGRFSVSYLLTLIDALPLLVRRSHLYWQI